MAKVFSIVFVIFGTIVGSGFSSGKEIVVFFSRFGSLSYLFILIACILLTLLFYFFLTNDISCKIESSKVLNGLVLFISLIFCASMFAGVVNLFSFFSAWVGVLLLAGVFLLCFLITKRGVKGLEKANLILMPVVGMFFLVMLAYATSVSSGVCVKTTSWFGLFYSILYVALNTSISGVVLSQIGRGISKKQAVWACVLSCLLLCVFLIFCNFVLLRNGNVILDDMPLLSIVKENAVMFVMTYFIILAGCWTTIISLTATLKLGIEKFFNKNKNSAFWAVFLPILISFAGFSEIVSMLYPLCSVLGLYVLWYLVFKKLKK